MSGRRAVLLFMAADLVAVVVIAAVGYFVVRNTAIGEATRDARGFTQAEARAVAPLLNDGLVRGDPAARRALDAEIRRQVLSDRVVRVKVWAADGSIVYSDDAALIGKKFSLGDQETTTLRTQGVEAELSDLNRPENQGERQYKKLLEVYLGTRTPAGTPLLFETYLRFDAVTANGQHVLRAFAPALIGGLLLLWLVQLPLVLGLTRRLSAGYEHERQLLTQAVESSDRERRRIAADLHDGVVQGLAGSAMSLSALAIEAQRRHDANLSGALTTQSSDLRQWVRELRTLVVSIAPPRLHAEGLAAALSDLVSTARAAGIDARVRVPSNLELARTAEALVFRGAQEAVRNVVEHAGAKHLGIDVVRDNGMVRLTVTDDGAGFDAASLADAPTGGHVGLRLLGDLAVDAGGELRVDARPGGGTTVVLEVLAR